MNREQFEKLMSRLSAISVDLSVIAIELFLLVYVLIIHL